MTLQSSGSMTIADINTELGRASGAQLSTDDAELVEMAWLTSSDPITIPDDLYGKAHLGTFQQEYSLTLGAMPPPNSYGTWVGSVGSTSPSTYRGSTIYQLISYDNTASYDFVFSVSANVAQSLITGIRFVEEGVFYNSVSSYSTGGGFTYWFFGNGSGGPWDATDDGLSKTIRIYGD